jgi:hypothetical protein
MMMLVGGKAPGGERTRRGETSLSTPLLKSASRDNVADDQCARFIAVDTDGSAD